MIVLLKGLEEIKAGQSRPLQVTLNTNTSKYPSLPLESLAINVVGVGTWWGRPQVHGLPRQSKKAGIGDLSDWEWMDLSSVERT
ncbi:hypothetical protein AVEN_217787-1 [Araneus ventricosus]|uniref:Uncharacterized protein n=1 Tax=Araneus ventricosus TaxID=182803 RepID=A0A4Y2J597_ARAVE|nr:hypothetical protein AVEN_217787-1 [Araneus ventricosus]